MRLVQLKRIISEKIRFTSAMVSSRQPAFFMEKAYEIPRLLQTLLVDLVLGAIPVDFAAGNSDGSDFNIMTPLVRTR